MANSRGFGEHPLERTSICYLLFVIRDGSSPKARNLPNNARSAERGGFHRLAPKHLRSRDNDQLSGVPIEMLRVANFPTDCDHAFVAPRDPFRLKRLERLEILTGNRPHVSIPRMRPVFD